MYSFTRSWIDFQLAKNAYRHQQRRQQHEQHRNTVHAHVVVDAEIFHPWNLFDELEVSCGFVEARTNR